MPPIEVPLLDAAGARAGGEAAVESGDTWAALMDRAAGHLADVVLEAVAARAGHDRPAHVVVAVGKGNNGGDGWAAARLLLDAGCVVSVVSSHAVDVELSTEAAAHRSAWLERRGAVGVGAEALAAIVDEGAPDVVVDAMLGTGISGAPRGEIGAMCQVVHRARRAGALVVACDVPSGVDADTGAAEHPAVAADVTVTFGARKRGLLLAPGRARSGRVVVGRLGPGFRASTDWTALTAAGAAPDRLGVAADKRARGVTLVVAGSVGAAGAAILATDGLLWSGAGLVTLATPAHVQRVIAPMVPSAMTRPLRHANQHVGADAVGQLDDVHAFDAVVAGPGLGPTDGTDAVVAHLRANARRLVLDADALNVHRDDPARLADHAGDLVVTPHERELARLGAGDDGPDAWQRRVEAVPRLARSWDATVVCKGPGTIVAAPDGRVWVTPIGGPELGVGGSGDVLAGMLGAAVATATDVPLAVARTVWQHAFVGAWLAAGRPAGPPRVDAVAATTAGFGPSSELPRGIPAAMRVLADLADTNRGWPFPPDREAPS